MNSYKWDEDVKAIIDKWLESDEGKAWEAAIYQNAFDEGFENARAIYGPSPTDAAMEIFWDEVLNRGYQ